MANNSDRQQPSGFRTFVWAIFFFFVFALVVVALVRNTGKTEAYEDKRATERRTIREELTKEAQSRLTSTAMVDQAKGIVRVPIEDAKKAIVEELKSKPVGPSQVKVDPWLPMPPPADPNAAEPPPPALTSAPQGADTIRFETAPSK
jgi:hypothetical protein